MKGQVEKLVSDDLDKLSMFIDDVFVENVEGKDILNIVVDSKEVIDLNRVTEASRIINKKLDNSNLITDNIYEVDIYSKEKGE
ncbi:MAG: hypothetical protein IJF92_01535 [Bacilli bacterium]|nr:hypothetical protein [Bacilli bacterium]